MEIYKIAYQMEAGEFDVVEEFEAEDNKSAEDYAEKNYPGTDWYVLDSKGTNING